MAETSPPRRPSYGYEVLSQMIRSGRRTVVLATFASLAFSAALLVLYRVYGDRGFLLAGVLMLAVTLVDSLILKALVGQSVASARRLVEDLSRMFRGPYAIAGGGWLRGLIIAARAGDDMLIVVVRGSRADLIRLNHPQLLGQRIMEDPTRARVKVGTGPNGPLASLLRELRASALVSCRKQEYEGELTVTGPHPESPVEATWRARGKMVRLRCPHPIDPRRLVAETSLLLGG